MSAESRSPAQTRAREGRTAPSDAQPEVAAGAPAAVVSGGPAAPPGDRSARDTPAVLAIALLVAVSYFPALQGGFVWDDVIFSEEPVIHSPDGLRSIWFSPADIRNEGHSWPLVYTSFWLEHKVWGLNPLGYHAVNILLHLVNCLLLWRLLDRLSIPGALLVDLLRLAPFALFSHIVALNPQARDAHLNLGNALIEAGRNEDALAASRIAVEQRPESAAAHSNLGLALMNLERLEEAGTALRRARELDPTHQSSLQNSAELLRKQGRYEEAVEAYRTVLQRDGRFALAYAGLGDALLQLQRYEAAIDALRAAIARCQLSAPPFARRDVSISLGWTITACVITAGATTSLTNICSVCPSQTTVTSVNVVPYRRIRSSSRDRPANSLRASGSVRRSPIVRTRMSGPSD